MSEEIEPQFQELTRDQVIRLQALDLSVSSKFQLPETSFGLVERAQKFEDYIRNGAQDAT